MKYIVFSIICLLYLKGFTQSKSSTEFVEIKSIRLDLRYATTNNFLNQKVYPCSRAYVRAEVYDALMEANKKAIKLGYQLVIFDAYRPISIQRKMHDIVENDTYVANPSKGSKHNRGCALDIGLVDSKGKILDFGTDFDDFSDKANYNSKLVSSLAKSNRKILREIMTESGFKSYDKEWWHFNYKNTDYPISDFVWTCDK